MPLIFGNSLVLITILALLAILSKATRGTPGTDSGLLLGSLGQNQATLFFAMYPCVGNLNRTSEGG